jgi:rRNA-processing protein FCF1
MRHIQTFESFINESCMSELDIIRQESKNLQQFIVDAKKEFPQIAKMKDADDFLEEIWVLGQEIDK